MDKQAFKQRMQNLKSYRENNPGKGYWDWKVQAYQNGGRHALGVGQVFASLADMLFNKERRTPAIAAAAYYTIHQTQNDPVLAPVEAPLVEPIADAIKSVDETPYDPGEVFLLSPENQKKQMTKNPNYRVVDTNSNLYYWMRSALKPFSRIDPNTDKLTKYYSKPTEQKAYMNQLREFMYANKMIDTRDQIVTPDLIKQAISKLPKGMQSIKKASEQFKSMRSYTKWFNTIPLLGVGAVGANKYFTSNENRD